MLQLLSVFDYCTKNYLILWLEISGSVLISKCDNPTTVAVEIIKCCFIYSQQWLFDRQDLLRERQVDYQIFTEDEYHKIMIFFASGPFIYPLILHL